MEIQVFRNENSSKTNAYPHYSNYSYSGLIPSERALRVGNMMTSPCTHSIESNTQIDTTLSISSREGNEIEYELFVNDVLLNPLNSSIIEE